MNDPWFDKDLNGVNDDFFDDVLKYLDFPFEDVQVNCGSGDSSGEGVIDHQQDKNISVADGEWDCDFQNLETPPANVLTACFDGSFFSDNLLSRDGSSQLIRCSRSTTKASSSRSITLQSEPADVKNLSQFQTSSPVSVLESSSSSTAANPLPISLKLTFPVKRGRSKRIRRASTFSLHFTSPFISSTSSTSRGSNSLVGYESESESYLTEKPAKKRQKKKKNLTLLSSTCEIEKSPSQQPVVVRKCMHCEVTKTPQWREGPMGPKTLCNACGVRYRSGRLLPEYRPAASPTFVPSLHSNSHKKVVEMRKKAKKLVTVAPSVSSFG